MARMMLAALMWILCPPFAAACQWDGAHLAGESFAAPSSVWSYPSKLGFGQTGLDFSGYEGVKEALYNAPIEAGSICATITLNGESDGTLQAGVIFWAKGLDDYHVAWFNPQGSFRVSRWSGAWRSVVPPTPTSRLFANSGYANEIEVRFQRNVAAVFINGAQVTSFSGNPEGGSLVGVAAQLGRSGAAWTIGRADIFRRPDIAFPILADNQFFLAYEMADLGVKAEAKIHDYPLNTDTPTSIPGGKVISTKELLALYQSKADMLVLDALGGPRRLPDAVDVTDYRLPGTFDDAVQERFRLFLARLAPDQDARIVVYCLSRQCWESYNVAQRAIHLGYRNVYWYRAGVEIWELTRLPTARSVSD